MEVVQEVAPVYQAEIFGASDAVEALPDPGKRYLGAKRALDLILSGLALALLSPLWALIALAVKLTSPGPVLYRTESLGLDARPFTLYKFRTMADDADERVHRAWVAGYVRENRPFAVEEASDGSKKPIFKVVNDPRVTRLGRFLRRTGLDEVPQFMNVLKGDMSIVGPRSPRPFEYEHYEEWAKQRVQIVPGITGLYQVTARATASFSEMVALDLEYARRRSIRLDLAIMFRTIPVMLLGKGGY